MTDIQTLQSPAEAARLFRSILTAFSKPAVAVPLAACPAAPAPLLPAAAAILLSLCDYQTPVWLSPSLNAEAVRKFIRFHTGAPITDTAQEATFAVLSIDEATSFIDLFPLGTDEYPDRSATLILQAAGLDSGAEVTVKGPGLQLPVNFAVEGADGAFWQRVQGNSQLFPIGLDFLFATQREIAALPRSMSVSIKENV